jgi:hypothetical protein
MKRLFATLALALAFMAGAAAANAQYIYGRLTIVGNQFILKTPEPFETDVSEKQDGTEIVTTSKIHVRCSKERRAEVRALVGKDVRILADVEPANTLQDCAPLVLFFDKDTEPFQVVNLSEYGY